MSKIEEEKKKHPIRNFFVFLLILLISLISWSRFISTSGLIVKEYGITNAKIPESFHGLKIIHFSDLHYGLTTNDDDLKNVVDKINEYKPDLVFFTGDLVDKSINIKEESKEKIISLLNQIDSSIEKIAVKGNHDYADDNFDDIFKETDFTVLNNENKLIYFKGEIPIKIIGLPSLLQEKHDYETAFNETEETTYYKIVLVHEPDTLTKLDSYNVDLMLSGHSHGGQVRLPFIGAIIKVNGARTYYDEYYKVNETDLYTSSGIGTSEWPFRFMNKPSINLYRLYTN